MKIQKKIYQHRRDFTAVYECEHCGHQVQGSGYDDAYFHQTVIPGMHCDECDRTSTGPSSCADVPAGVVL